MDLRIPGSKTELLSVLSTAPTGSSTRRSCISCIRQELRLRNSVSRTHCACEGGNPRTPSQGPRVTCEMPPLHGEMNCVTPVGQGSALWLTSPASTRQPERPLNAQPFPRQRGSPVQPGATVRQLHSRPVGASSPGVPEARTFRTLVGFGKDELQRLLGTILARSIGAGTAPSAVAPPFGAFQVNCPTPPKARFKWRSFEPGESGGNTAVPPDSWIPGSPAEERLHPNVGWICF